VKLLKNFRILLIATLVSSCAGKPPEMERPLTMYYGEPSRGEMCQAEAQRVLVWVQKNLRYKASRKYAAKLLHANLNQLATASSCISAKDPRFGTLVGLPVNDLGMLLKHMENLVYSCEKWKQ